MDKSLLKNLECLDKDDEFKNSITYGTIKPTLTLRDFINIIKDLDEKLLDLPLCELQHDDEIAYTKILPIRRLCFNKLNNSNLLIRFNNGFLFEETKKHDIEYESLVEELRKSIRDDLDKIKKMIIDKFKIKNIFINILNTDYDLPPRDKIQVSFHIEQYKDKETPSIIEIKDYFEQIAKPYGFILNKERSYILKEIK